MKTLLFVLFALGVGNLYSQEIYGLWLVESVRVQQELMTPQGKWIRFDSNGTQQSGNGWKQHSLGTWELRDSMLSIETNNAPPDDAGAFKVKCQESAMEWTRIEDGNEVIVQLRRIEDNPTTNADRVLGYWGSSDGEVLLIRWDGLYEWTIDEVTEVGMYRIHGHRPLLEMVPRESPSWNRWLYHWEGETLILEQRGGAPIRKVFERID